MLDLQSLTDLCTKQDKPALLRFLQERNEHDDAYIPKKFMKYKILLLDLLY